MMNLKSITKTAIVAMCFLSVVFLCNGCTESSTEQINDIKKPAVVFTKHQSNYWYESSTMSLKDADGKIVNLTADDEVKGLIDKYNVGDTIR